MEMKHWNCKAKTHYAILWMLSFKQCCHGSTQVDLLREGIELQETEITLFLNDNIHTEALMYLSSLFEPNSPNFSESFHLESS